MRCAYCGKKLRDAAKFCPYCGKPTDGSIVGSEFAEKFDSKDGLLVVKAQEIFSERRFDGGTRRVPVKWLIITLCTAAVCASAYLFVKFAMPEISYRNAEKLYVSGSCGEAADVFSKLGDYKDSEKYVLKCRYGEAERFMDEGLFPEAADAFTSLNGYLDSDRLAAECMLKIADAYAENGDLESAGSMYAAAGKPELITPAAERKAESLAEDGDFFAAAEIAEKYISMDAACEYNYSGASAAQKNGDFKTASEKFRLLGDYKDSEKLFEECAYGYYSGEYENGGATEEIVRGFYFLGGYLDSRELFEKASYEYGSECFENGDFFSASAMFRNAGAYKNSAEMLYRSRYELGSSLIDTDPASARSVFALMSTYSDSAEKKRIASQKLENGESWYADGFASTDGYCSSAFKKSDVLTVFCTAGTDSISAPVTLSVVFRDSAGTEISADCDVRNSGSFSVSLPLSSAAAGDAEIVIFRKDSGSVLRSMAITVAE